MPRKYKKYETEDLVWAKKQGFPWPGKKETVSFDHEMSSAEDDDDEREQGAMEVDTVMRSKDEKVEEPQRRISQRLRVKLLTQEDNRKEKKGGRKNKKEKCCASPFQYPPVNIWNKEEIRKIITKKLVISLRRYHD